MKILVDADACPVKQIIEDFAQKHSVPVLMVSNINHNITSDYAEIIVVDGASQSADIAIVNHTQKGDLVVTQDYGLAALVLAKGSYAIHPGGKEYCAENIDSLLMQRYLNEKTRRAGGRTSGPKKRSLQDDLFFTDNLEKIMIRALNMLRE